MLGTNSATDETRRDPASEATSANVLIAGDCDTVDLHRDDPPVEAAIGLGRNRARLRTIVRRRQRQERHSMQDVHRPVGGHPGRSLPSNSMAQRIATVSSRIATATGNDTTFIAMTLVVVLWAVSGPLFGFSETWQLVINTGTTIVTLLIVFLIQNT
jgi:hypothetical protein